MSSEYGEEIKVYSRCRIDNARGFNVIEAAKRRTIAGKCPLKGEKFRMFLQAKYGSREANIEILSHLPNCDVCELDSQRSDFSYTITNPNGDDDLLPFSPSKL